MLREAPRPLSILMVLESNFTQKGGGGAESQVRTVSLALKKMGQDVVIVTPLLPQGPQKTVDEAYGLAIERVSYPRWRIIGGGVMMAKFAAYLWQHRNQHDAWHVHIGHHMGAITCLLGDLLGKPVVVKISGWWELENGLLGDKKGPFTFLFRRWLKKATAVQAISTRIAAELERHGFPKDRILILPNAVDTERFVPCAAERKPGEPFVAVFVGRLVPEKDLATLFDAWAEAFGTRKDVRLRLVGGGPAEKDLRAQAEQLGISVEFLGHRDRVEEVLAEAHVGVLTSRIEGLSNTLLEFMACGLPSLASRVSGNEDFVKTGDNGWLFEPGDKKGLAAALREAEALPAEKLARLGKNARAAVQSQASIERVLGRLMSLYGGRR
jgi:glycosyltransferase involved in cell wall biosynthesis